MSRVPPKAVVASATMTCTSPLPPAHVSCEPMGTMVAVTLDLSKVVSPVCFTLNSWQPPMPRPVSVYCVPKASGATRSWGQLPSTYDPRNRMEYSNGKPVLFWASVARTCTEPSDTKGNPSSASFKSNAEAL